LFNAEWLAQKGLVRVSRAWWCRAGAVLVPWRCNRHFASLVKHPAMPEPYFWWHLQDAKQAMPPNASLASADPIAAVTHADPYPYYRDLASTRPFHFDPH
jgi:hypothetical protein